VYHSTGLWYYRHPDWLASSRLETTPTGGNHYNVGYAPFGEPYGDAGTEDLSFTGQNQDTVVSTVPGGAGGLYDFLYREQSPVQGRWLSPDPARMAAANPADPQSWNRYAYVGNRPLNSVDALGLVIPVCDEFDPDCIGGGGGGECPPEDLFCYNGCDPTFDFCPLPGGGGGGDGGGGGGGGSGGGSHPPQRKGGVWANNETLGLPTGLNQAPLGLGDLIGLNPGCNFAVCNPLGNGFVAGVDDAAEAAIAVRIFFYVVAAYEVYKVSQQTKAPTANVPCDPPAGTKCYEGHSGHSHNGWDPHYHIWTQNQNPFTGQCFWNRGGGTSGATDAPPSGMQDCSSYISWPTN